jgi:hypothetical protein
MAAAATTGTRLLLIDGAEQMLTDGGALLRSLLEVVPRAPDAQPWRLLVTARDEAPTRSPASWLNASRRP